MQHNSTPDSMPPQPCPPATATSLPHKGHSCGKKRKARWLPRRTVDHKMIQTPKIKLTHHGRLHCPSLPKTTCHCTHAAHLALGQPLLDALCVEDVVARQHTNLVGRL